MAILTTPQRLILIISTILLLVRTATSLPNTQITNITAEASSPEQQQQLGPAAPAMATLYTGSPGSKTCRGKVLMQLAIGAPAAQYTAPMCYNLASLSQCGEFRGTQADGCEARLYIGTGCDERSFMDLAVFMPEKESRPYGGRIQSVSVKCGVRGVAPPPLSLPGYQQMGKGEKPLTSMGKARR